MTIERAREVLQIEADAVAALIARLDEEFVKAVRAVLACQGRVVVTGMGKSGAIARKIASTLASTGTPALFLDPADGLHGDLGMVTKDDLLMIISYSGETEEVVTCLPFIKRLGIGTIIFTGNRGSTLASNALSVLDVFVEREACPFNLAPTASTTAALAMGDALAIAVMSEREFDEDDFARFHPGGTLGRRLLLRVKDVMRTGARLAVVREGQQAREALFAITQARGGAVAVVDEKGEFVGIVTDGDVRRHLLEDESALRRPVSDVMTRSAIILHPDQLASEALQLMQSKQIDDVPVLDDNRSPIGMLDVMDLLAAGIV